MKSALRIQFSPFTVVAFFIIAAFLLWAFGFALLIPDVRAESLTSYSDTLSDSDLNVVSNHTITFTTLNGVSAGESFTVNFDDNFTFPVLAILDFDLAAGGEKTLDYEAAGATWGVATSTGGVVTFTSGTDTIASSTVVTIEIGTNATAGGNGANQITNPAAADSYVIQTTLPEDSGDTRVAIVDDVVVTASVDTSFTFTVSGVAEGLTVNGDATTTATTTTATSLPFGTLKSNIEYLVAQDLAVSTNAANGFSVTVFQDQNLKSETGADIEKFANDDATTTPIAWESPLNTLDDHDTYGHMGVTSEDSDLNSDEFGAALYAGNFGSTTNREIFAHNGPADGTTADKGLTRVGYKIEITDLQEAGNDYTNTLTYIATPTF